MNNQQGTLELIAVELSKLFTPLSTRLQEGNARVLFAQLGYVVSESQETAIANTLTAVTLTVEELVSLSLEIIEAVEQEDYTELTKKVIDAGLKTGQLIDSFPDLQNALSGQGVVGDLSKFSERLFGYLLSEYFYRQEGFGPVFELLGIIEREDFNLTSEDPENPPYTVSKFFFNRIFGWLGDPVGELEDQFDWGTGAFDGTKLLPRLAKMIGSTGLPAAYLPDNAPPLLDMIFLEAFAKTDIDPKGLFIGFAADISLESLTITDNDWEAEFSFAFSIPSNAGLVIQPDGQITLVPPDTSSDSISGEADIKVTVARTTSPEPFVIIGQTGGSRVEFLKAGLGLGTRLVWDSGAKKAGGEFSIGGSLTQGKIIIDASEGDGFLQNVMPGTSMDAAFDIMIGYSSETGFYFEGSSTLEIKLPLHVSIGPIDFVGLTIGLSLKPDELPVSLGGDIRANLGPLVAVVENMGIIAKFSFPEGGGNLGPLNGSIGFKPPSGVGLSIDAGAVKGGGYLFFDTDREEYAGALELVFSEWIALKAIGLITTKMPDGSQGFSLLIIITVEFGSGFQLGFGFTLNGVGGLLGLHRIVRVDPLKEGIRTGAVESVMFPKDVVANAPRIISDLRRFFPPQQDIFLVGPMAKIGWGTPTLISVQLGVILEFPQVNITILGVIKVILPDEKADILRLQVNFIGRIEPSNQLLWFYAELFDSRVLFITLEGGMGLYVNWGDNANFVVSVGGFHPRYSPPPLPFPEPPRIAANILNESWARVRIEGYFAVTSNSVQFGARAELFFGLSAFKIEGHLAFDALFQFNPFFFSFSLSFSLSVKVFGVGLWSVGFSGLLEGPTPWHIKGKGKISLLFFSISVPFEHTWGQRQDTKLDPIEVFPLLEIEFEALTNWEARLPESSNILVSLRKLGETDSDQLVLHPVGKLRISQRKVPVNFKLDKVGNQRPADVFQVDVDAALPGSSLSVSKIEEKFAIGQFKDLNGSSQLSSPAFEPLESGLEIGMVGEQIETSRAVRRVIRYETIIIDNNYKRHIKTFFGFFVTGYASLNAFLFTHFLGGSAVKKSVLSQHHKKRMQPFDEVIQVQSTQYSVVFNTDNRPIDTGATTFTSQAKALEYMERQVQSDAGLANRLHVIPNTELNLTL